MGYLLAVHLTDEKTEVCEATPQLVMASGLSDTGALRMGVWAAGAWWIARQLRGTCVPVHLGVVRFWLVMPLPGG